MIENQLVAFPIHHDTDNVVDQKYIFISNKSFLFSNFIIVAF